MEMESNCPPAGFIHIFLSPRERRNILNDNALLNRLNIQHPIIQAPMAGGPSTPELVAAVSNAGGMGSLGGAYSTPEQIKEDIRKTRALTDRPFNVNLFAGAYDVTSAVDPTPMLAFLNEVHQTLGIPAPELPPAPKNPFPAQFEALLETRPPVFSFTFGIPDKEVLQRARSAHMAILGTATTLEEARMLAAAGVDGIVAQGAEAGAHRGTFAGPFDSSMVPTLDLVHAIARSVPVPVIASGGLMDGRDLAAALRAGASAVQMGTAFLACPESGASEIYKQAILAAKQDTTEITRAFSGRPARGLVNAWMQKLKGREDAILPYPVQNSLTRAMRTAAAKRGEAGYLSLWAGQGVTRARSMPAGELVRRLVEEMKAVAA
jgi:nitronate monooxygenase